MNKADAPNLIVVMGVSGSGKSTLAASIAARLGYRYLDGDDYHLAHAKAKMSAGQGISDEERQRWVDRICLDFTERAKQGQSIVFAFSGLKVMHRKQLYQLAYNQWQFLLTGEQEVIYQRMQNRVNHFANPALLQSQLASFEKVGQNEPYICQLSLVKPLRELIEQVIGIVKE